MPDSPDWKSILTLERDPESDSVRVRFTTVAGKDGTKDLTAYEAIRLSYQLGELLRSQGLWPEVT